MGNTACLPYYKKKGFPVSEKRAGSEGDRHGNTKLYGNGSISRGIQHDTAVQGNLCGHNYSNNPASKDFREE